MYLAVTGVYFPVCLFSIGTLFSDRFTTPAAAYLDGTAARERQDEGPTRLVRNLSSQSA